MGGRLLGTCLVGNILLRVGNFKVKLFFAKIQEEGQELYVSCKELSGETLSSTNVASYATVPRLPAKRRAAMQCENARRGVPLPAG